VTTRSIKTPLAHMSVMNIDIETNVVRQIHLGLLGRNDR